MTAAKRIGAKVQQVSGANWSSAMLIAQNLAYGEDPLAAREAGWVARAAAMRRSGPVKRSFCAAVCGAGDNTLAANPKYNR